MKPGIDYIGVNVSFFCHDGNGKILLQKRSLTARDEQGRWESGGGQVLFGEMFEEAVLREIQEEYGCEAVIELALPPLPILRVFNGVETHWVNHPFVVRLDPAALAIGGDDAVDSIGWFTYDALPEPLHSGMQIQLTHHGEKIRAHLKLS